MMLASNGILEKDIETVEKECKSYVDELFAQGKLPPRGYDLRWYDGFIRASYGFVYWVTDEYRESFQSVLRHLIEARERALDLELPKLAPELLKIVETDGQQFLDQVCFTRTGNNQYAAIPILAALAPEDFVAAWMRSPKSNWHWISGALKDRCRGHGMEGVLKPESEWLNQVVDLLKAEAEAAAGLAKQRIVRVISGLALRREDP